MAQQVVEREEKNVYRVQGFTCASCAAIFEKNVKEIAGVTDAKVNFGASKIAVYGTEPSIEQLEQAGAFENLKVVPEHQQDHVQSIPFWKNQENLPLFFSLFFLVMGWGLHQFHHDEKMGIVFYAAAILIGGFQLFVKGIQNLFRLQFDMGTLMTIAILGAAAIGEWGEGATVVILFAISEALERYSMNKARQSIRSLLNIAPKRALIRRKNEEIMIRVDEIQIGDILIVKPGQKLAMDGIVVKGTSMINQSAITGESIPVRKTVSDEVFAGTLNGEGLIEVKVTKRAEDTTLAKIIHLVEEAQAERAPAQAFVDRFAKIYTPVILVVGILVAIVPPLFFHFEWSEWIYRGLALLVVGCPCALVISTPVAIVTAIGNAARNGVLIKGGIYLEETGLLTALAFDKTGTLTKGTPAVTDIVTWKEGKERKYLSVVAAIEKNTDHPLASAFIRKANEEGVKMDSLQAENVMSRTGKGVQAEVDGVLYYVGSPNWLDECLTSGLSEKLMKKVQQLQDQGKTVIILGTQSEPLALFAVRDVVRESSKKVIDQLHQLGIAKTLMVTGDHHKTAQAIGKEIGIKEIQAELLPKEKLDWIKQLRSKGHRVAMVGDGVNDAPALAAANVGIAMGGAGTDTALETADIALMADDLRKLPFTIRLSRKALQIIKQNITFSLAIKAIALLLIIPGWLTLWMAIFADMGATLIVTLNALRLLNVKGI